MYVINCMIVLLITVLYCVLCHTLFVLSQGLLRQVPLVGGMLSWFMPAEPAAQVPGRSLNLQSGKSGIDLTGV